MSEAAAWYYVGSFGQLGPLTLEQMEELIEGGVIEKSTYVWKPGMTDWLPAGHVTELLNSFKIMEPFASPPPIPGSTPPVSSPTPPQEGASIPGYRSVSMQTYGVNRTLVLPKSDKSRTLAGILQLLCPGLGRMYLGYAALGTIQLILTPITCFTLYLWSVVDGIMILSGKVRIDGYGRALED
ncbi:MAG: DUF4339 domain-containing protein [Armatimonadetes bacterium]|nr:DUF4339 domain-containing protein [Armatimonadota bacterium]MBS1700530.1 DUF4339 domain-containing protein [Armatimonadota bacterium]MBS1728985.1 DUF4339 domain-containing protein [Armatimonadota bacterium]